MSPQGFVDSANAQAISGWAWRPDTPERAAYVDLYDGEILLVRLRADLYRPDLAQAGIGNGCHAFQYILAESQRDGCEHEIHVCFEGSPVELVNSPLHVVFGDIQHRTHQLAKRLRSIAPVATWNIDAVTSSDQFLSVQGWAIPPLNGKPVGFAVNGEALVAPELSYPIWRPDVANVFWYVPGSARSGFACSIDCRAHGFSENDLIRIDYVDGKRMCPWGDHQAFYLRPSLLNALHVIPPEDGILRVAGYTSGAKFLLDGFTTLVKLREVVEQVASRSLSEFSSILDWGCGCGRLTRHLIEEVEGAQTRIVGIDIDRTNVQWCQNHLPRASFDHCGLNPPTKLRTAAFDLIIGLSVVTHLNEATQFAWLNELRRVAMPGALLLLTVHGNTSVCRSNVNTAWLDQWTSRGMDDSWKDPALTGVIDNDEYYRATFHTKTYVKERWADYFDIVTIMEGFLSNNQDLVVLRAR